MNEPMPALVAKVVAARLREAADLMELLQIDAHKAPAYRRAAQAASQASEPLSLLAQEGRLQELPGVGPAIAKKIGEILATGSFALLDRLRAQVPTGLYDVLTLSGVGPRTAGRLYRELGITDLASLAQAVEAGRLRQLAGLGSKKEEAIAKSLAHTVQAGTKLLLVEALPVSEALVAQLRQQGWRAEAAGEIRRRLPQVPDLLLVAAAPGGTIEQAQRALPQVVWDAAPRPAPLAVAELTGRVADLPLRLRVCRPEHWIGALFAATGPEAHAVALAQRLAQGGRSLDEAWPDESALYRAADWQPLPPEVRAHPEAGSWLESGVPPLLCVSDLRGDLHAHTTWSDGTASLEQMGRAARARGYRYLAITDHSVSLRIAHGLDVARLRAQGEEIRSLNERFAAEAEAGEPQFQLLAGVEVDILKGGVLDLPDEALQALDVVVASVHSGLRGTREELTQRVLAAVEHPAVDILGHPTGRILGRREGYGLDWERVFRAAARSGTALELSASPWRLDLDAGLAYEAARAGVWLVTNTDAHSTAELDQMPFGVTTARSAGLKREQVVNTRELAALRRWLGRGGG